MNWFNEQIVHYQFALLSEKEDFYQPVWLIKIVLKY